MLSQAQSAGHVNLTLPSAQSILAVMNDRIGDPYQHLTAIYWSVSPSALSGTLDQIRTKLVELLVEIKAGIPGGESTPSADLADQAVQLVVNGKGHRITVAQSRASKQAAISAPMEPNEPHEHPLWWKTGAIVVGVATVVGALVALAQWQHWGLGA
jgi:hypothetical protein